VASKRTVKHAEQADDLAGRGLHLELQNGNRRRRTAHESTAQRLDHACQAIDTPPAPQPAVGSVHWPQRALRLLASTL
jgi:hypothetical protein